MKIQYVEGGFKKQTLEIIEKANIILEDWHSDGYKVTLRQLYYEFISKDWFPESWIDEAYNLRKGLALDTKNTDKNYSRLGSIVNDGRLKGLIDWDHMQDRMRSLKQNSHWGTPSDIIESCVNSFRIDKWAGQEFRPEVWIEKDALVGVIEGVCKDNDVPYFVCRGYTSQSAMWEAGQRLHQHTEDGYTPIIFHLGDHDPSGIDMSRDIRDRLEMFMGGTEFNRLALNWDQVQQYSPPPNPAKVTDSRAKAYIAEFGAKSWELDALGRNVMREMIQDALIAIRNDDLWKEKVEEEREHIRLLKAVSAEWGTIIEDL